MDLNDIFRFVAPEVRTAAIQTSEQLKKIGVRHALAGGLAVGAHGYVRATTYVDFLVGEEAFESHGGLVTFKAGVPIEVGGIRIDYLSPVALGAHMERALEQAPQSLELAVVPIEALIYMKLVAKRRKDLLDVVELLRRVTCEKAISDYLQTHSPELLPLFHTLSAEALEDS